MRMTSMPYYKKSKTNKSKEVNSKFLMNKSNILYLILLAFVIIFLTVILPRWLYVGTSPPDTGNCLANYGYKCLYWIYAGASGNVTVTIGQNTGIKWATAKIYFVPQGSQVNYSGVPVLLSTGILSGNIIADGLASGSTARVTLPMSSPKTAPGVVNSGTIWAVYSTSFGGSTYYAKIATATFRAV